MSGVGDTTVTAWVKLVAGGVDNDPCSVVVDPFGTVELTKGAIMAALSSALTGVHPVQVKLFLSDAMGSEAASPSPTGTALKPNKSLRSEVERVRPDEPVPPTLYLFAVVEGAWGWPGWPPGGEG